MGKQDSSRTRVAPVFGHLYCRDVSGRTWLPGLLRLVEAECPDLAATPLKRANWWPHEAALPAPTGLLLWLLENCVQPADLNTMGSATTRERRVALLRRDPLMLAEAKSALGSRPSARAWYSLEGPSQPDAYLETDDLIVIVEGKRTEPAPTTTTTWMPVRHQMLRHIDAAWDSRGGRTVVGLMIVEGQNAGPTPPSPWLDYRASLEDSPALRASLPHRSDEDRRAILGAFAGVTTWQAVMSVLDIPKEVLVDRVASGGL